MSDLIFRENSAFGGKMVVVGPHGICPTHGEVDGNFHAYVTSNPDYRTPNICPKCYIDWVSASVTAVTPKGGVP